MQTQKSSSFVILDNLVKFLMKTTFPNEKGSIWKFWIKGIGTWFGPKGLKPYSLHARTYFVFILKIRNPSFSYIALFKICWAAWIFPLRVLSSAARRRNGCFSSSSLDARWSTSTSRHRSRKFWNSGLNLFQDGTCGRPLVAIKYKALSWVSFR